MTEKRKELYRDLLRWAMVDMRMYSSQAAISSWRLVLTHQRSRRKILRFIYAMNNWLHNTALYSAINFEGFQESLFWEDYRRFRREFPIDQWAGLTEMIIKELQAIAD